MKKVPFSNRRKLNIKLRRHGRGLNLFQSPVMEFQSQLHQMCAQKWVKFAVYLALGAPLQVPVPVRACCLAEHLLPHIVHHAFVAFTCAELTHILQYHRIRWACSLNHVLQAKSRKDPSLAYIQRSKYTEQTRSQCLSIAVNCQIYYKLHHQIYHIIVCFQNNMS